MNKMIQKIYKISEQREKKIVFPSTLKTLAVKRLL